MTFIRTVLGDINAAGDLGVTYAHEHLVRSMAAGPVGILKRTPSSTWAMWGRWPGEVADAAALGLQAVVDAMPCDAGRNAGKLATSRAGPACTVDRPACIAIATTARPTGATRLTIGEMADLFASRM